MNKLNSNFDSPTIPFSSPLKPKTPIQRSQESLHPQFNIGCLGPSILRHSPFHNPFNKKFKKLKEPILEKRKRVENLLSFISKTKINNYVDRLSEEVQPSAERVEKYIIEKNVLPWVVNSIRTTIASIGLNHELSPFKKLAEMGALYFYVVCGREFPNTSSPLKYRQDEILKNAINLKIDHKKNCSPEHAKLLPSGSMVYIMRALVRMIFPPDGTFSLEGCHAVLYLLNTEIAVFLSEEHREQIINCVNRIIKEESFRTLFTTAFDIHEPLIELLRIDLKLPENAKITPLHIQWDLLMALFLVLGQLEEGNCFAVSFYLVMLNKYPDVLLKTLIEVLKKGTFDFEGAEIPILTLIESRKKYEKDFECKLKEKNPVDLLGYSIASSLHLPENDSKMGLTFNTQEYSVDLSLGKTIENHFGLASNKAKESFSSLKMHMLGQIMFNLIQFVSLNSMEIMEINHYKYKSDKYKLLDSINIILENNFDKNTFFQNISQFFYETLYTRLFLVDCKNWKIEVKDGRVEFDFHSQGLLFEGELKNYSAFMNMRRLFYLHEGKLYPIDSITEFSNRLLEILNEIPTPLKSKNVAKEKENMKKYFTTNSFRESIAKYIHTNNSFDCSFIWEKYEQSDAFFLIQQGGFTEHITRWEPLKNRFSFLPFFKSSDASHFFKKLCNKISFCFKDKSEIYEQSNPKMIGMIEGVHAFVLTPLLFKSYWKNPQDIERTILEAGTKLFSKGLTQEQKKRIIGYIVNPNEVDKWIKKIAVNKLGIKSFKELLLKEMPGIEQKLGIKIVNLLEQVVEEVSYTQIKKDLSSLLAVHQIKMTNEEILNLCNLIPEVIEPKKLLTPYAHAKWIQKALLKSNIHLSIHDIEKTIRSHYKFSEKIRIGNLLWVKELREKLNYYSLILKYDWESQKVSICTQFNGQDEFDDLLADEILRGFSFHYES